MARILIVDDEDDVARAWRRALRLAGHTVLIANSGARALALSKASPFDVIVADYIMPSMTGVELLNEIRRVQPFIRSIIISGKLDSGTSEEGILAEIRTNLETDLFLHKPVDNARLREAIAGLLTEGDNKDWALIAETKLTSTRPKKAVRAVEKSLNRRRMDKTKR
jgi:CheY-like chemotaxis protein